ncbi:MAG TPA: STAS domain-containing protein [Victivallales bacterium]|nr:STAS domain-containing protein [Victivallales bacterium]
MKAKVSVACDNKEYHIQVEGRATFEVSPSLRSLALRIGSSPISGIYIHLDNCTGMDSTFIGVLAMLGLEAKKQNSPAMIVNADENNRKLLNGLGLHKIFLYTQSENSDINDKKWQDNSLPPKQDPMETAQTVLNAHETLMNIEESNVQRFKNVVDFVKKDIEKNKEK